MAFISFHSSVSLLSKNTNKLFTKHASLLSIVVSLFNVNESVSL